MIGESSPVSGVDAHARKLVDYERRIADLERVVARGALVRKGSGTPEGVVAAPVGSMWLRTNGGPGSTLYVKESGGIGATGWTAK